MIPALILGRGGSSGLPGKNTKPILGRPLMSYPIRAAQSARCINNVYLSTDDPSIAAIGQELGCHLIERPPLLATNTALAEDAFIHGFEQISVRLGVQPDIILLLFCNAATVLPEYIEHAYERLLDDPTIDSVVTASPYNMWSPLRARKLLSDGTLVPFINPTYFGSDVNCDRSSQGDCYYADCSMFMVRSKCLVRGYGDPPFQWMGKNVKTIQQWGGLDIDFAWQVPIVEYWLREHGFVPSPTGALEP